MSSQRLPQQQTIQPNCQVCNVESVPESNQHIIMLIFEIALLFINWKFSIILLMIGYSFPRTLWKCSFCNRQIGEVKSDNPICQNIIIRMGNCMALFSLNKFRIIAIAIAGLMVYLYLNEPKYKPSVAIVNTWQSIVQNCGYEAYMENSFRANHFYQKYCQTGYNWELYGVFLSRKMTGIEDYEYLSIKMNPTQFKDENAHDFRVFTRHATGIDLQRGEIVYLKGEWEGRKYHDMTFHTIEIRKTGKKYDFKDIEYIYQSKSMLRSHFDSVKQDYVQTKQEKVEDKKNQIRQQTEVNDQVQNA